MDVIRIPNVDGVSLDHKGTTLTGTIHLTLHHLIFQPLSSPELWIPYPLINQVHQLPQTFNGLSPISIRTRLFETFVFSFKEESTRYDVFETIKDLTVSSSIEKLYAFTYTPSPPLESTDGWNVFTPREEFTRMGVGVRTKAWRFTDINKDYSFSSTYPARMAVPARISDTVLTSAAKYRSKERIPALTYLHWANHATITRSSQPLVGLKQARSIQDEKLIEAIFQTHLFNDSALTPNNLSQPRQVYGATATNLIVDARPTTNAMANVAKGAGTENMDNYRLARKVYLNIENIHVMRDSLNKVVEALRESEPVPGTSSTVDLVQPPPLDRQALRRSNWLKHTTSILEGSAIIVRNIHINSSHVLIHCSDGWDRTAQLSAVAQLCLDPYYRTLKGFMVLVEKDWLSFGHKFMDRCGHLSSDHCFHSLGQGEPSASSTSAQEDGSTAGSFGGTAQTWFASVQKQFSFNSHLKETSPVFHQFLDTVWQIQRQYPTRFEFNAFFLQTMVEQLYACQFGTFLFNSERERRTPPEFAPRGSKPPQERTVSVWDWITSGREKGKYLNEAFDPMEDTRESSNRGVLFPNPKDVRFWADLFRRGDEEMNGKPIAVVPVLEEPEIEGKEDPVVDKVVKDSELIQQGVLISTGAALPYRPGKTTSPSPSPSPDPALASTVDVVPPTPSSPDIFDGRFPVPETYRPFSSTTSAFSLKPSPSKPTDRGRSASPSQPLPASPSFRSTPSSPSNARGLALPMSSSGHSSWGGTWAQFSSGARNALTGAAKEIGRVANQATLGGGGGNGGGGSSRDLSSSGSNSWQEEKPFATVVQRGPSALPNASSTTEGNPWAEEDQTSSILRADGDSPWILAPSASPFGPGSSNALAGSSSSTSAPSPLESDLSSSAYRSLGELTIQDAYSPSPLSRTGPYEPLPARGLLRASSSGLGQSSPLKLECDARTVGGGSGTDSQKVEMDPLGVTAGGEWH